MTACVRCNAAQFRPSLTGYGFDRAQDRFDLVECRSCLLVSLSPMPEAAALEQYYDADYYGGGAAGKFNPVMEALVRWGNELRAEALLAARRRSRNTAAGGTSPRPLRVSGRVLDVGCGRGHFLAAMAGRGWDCYGTERAEFPAGDAPKAAGQGTITLVKGAFDDLPFADGFFDAVSIWHVLEHMPDPGRTIRNAVRTLKPGGVLALAVPNYSSVQRKLFGRHWFHLDLPRHCWHFGRSVLLGWLGDHGLEIVRVSTFSAEQNLFGFVQSGLNMVFGRRWPNGFYRLLHRPPAGRAGAAAQAIGRTLALAGYGALAAAALPLALAEAASSAAMGKGATLIVYARKPGLEERAGAERTQP